MAEHIAYPEASVLVFVFAYVVHFRWHLALACLHYLVIEAPDMPSSRQ
jgi:hypothetical protein